MRVDEKPYAVNVAELEIFKAVSGSFGECDCIFFPSLSRQGADHLFLFTISDVGRWSPDDYRVCKRLAMCSKSRRLVSLLCDMLRL